MGIEEAKTEKGRDSARGLRKNAAKEEKKLKLRKGRIWQKVPIASKSVPRVPTARAQRPSKDSETVPHGDLRDWGACHTLLAIVGHSLSCDERSVRPLNGRGRRHNGTAF